MKIRRFFPVLALAVAMICASVTPAFGVSKEIVQLQTQVDNLQAQMSRLQQSLDESMGVMKSLINQNTDSMNKATTAISNLQTSLQKQQADSGTHSDQLSGQIQALNDSLDELKARLAKISVQVDY